MATIYEQYHIFCVTNKLYILTKRMITSTIRKSGIKVVRKSYALVAYLILGDESVRGVGENEL